jgi:hypothetical protein
MSLASPAMAFHCKGSHASEPGCEVPVNPNQSVATYVEMFTGDEVVIVENGPLSLIARCVVPSRGTGSEIQLLYSSSEDNWLVGVNTLELQVAREFRINAVTSDETTDGPRMNSSSEHRAVALTGHYIGIDGQIGVNVRTDCFVAGQVTSTVAPSAAAP